MDIYGSPVCSPLPIKEVLIMSRILIFRQVPAAALLISAVLAGSVVTATPQAPPDPVRDQLNIVVFRNPELSMTVPIRPDGTIAAPLVDDIPAVGKDPSTLARDIEKALRSAIANAVNVADRNQKRRLDEDDLYVSACYANQGPSFKRVRPAPMGRAYRVIRRTTHLTVHVSERES